jgi:glycosyltransferase involved in cell wall biosynthesis
MDERSPMISVGLAVYNGEAYLREAVDSILAQTYTDFELILSDNASTDSTEQICREYAAIDSRVRYSRNPVNIGGANNENLTFQLSRGKYFHLAAHDDVIANDFLEKCLAVLESKPEIVLCYTEMIIIDGEGNKRERIKNQIGLELHAYQRFGRITRRFHLCESIYGLIRSDAVRKTELQKNYTNSDRTFLSELGLYGRFYQIPEPLFFKRLHEKNVFRNWRTRMAWFDSSYVGKIALPYWIQYADYFRTIRKAAPSLKDKLLCYLYMLGPYIWEHARYMVKDVVYAIYMLMHSVEWRKQRYESSNNWS